MSKYFPATRAIRIAAAMVLAGAGGLGTACRPRPEQQLPARVPILMYHDLTDRQTPFTARDVWTVQADAFERHLQSLKAQGYETVLPDDLAQAVRGRGRLPDKPVVITFDDGFLSALTHAEPLLEKYGYRAIVYLITDRIADSHEERQNYRAGACLIWPEVRAMLHRGTITFGSHSHTHSPRLSDTAAEMEFSRNLIRARTGFRPDSFCYPHGQHNAALRRAADAAGYTTAMVCEDKIALIDRDTDLMALPRVSVFGGIHDFVVERLPESVTGPGRVGVRVHNPGRPLPVTPRLTGAHLPDEQQWLPDTRLEATPQEWIWPLGPQADIDALRLEIWDRNRVLLLFSAP